MSQLQGHSPPVPLNFSSNRNVSFGKIRAGERERGLGKEISCGKCGFVVQGRIKEMCGWNPASPCPSPTHVPKEMCRGVTWVVNSVYHCRVLTRTSLGSPSYELAWNVCGPGEDIGGLSSSKWKALPLL